MWLSKDKRSGYYRVFWTDAVGKQKSLSTKCTVEADAKAWAKTNKIEELETAARMGVLTPQLVSRFLTGSVITVAAAIDRFLEWGKTSRSLSTTTVETMGGTLRAWARDTNLSDRPINSVTPNQIAEYVNRSSEHKVCTARNELSILRRFFTWCVAETIAVRNPASNCRLSLECFSHGQKESKRREPFTPEEVETLVTKTNGFWRVACALAAFQGGRLGDIAALEWESISEDGVLTYWSRKTDTRVSVKLSPEVVRLLSELPQPHTGYVFPEECTIANDPKRRALLSVRFGRVLEKLGIEGKSFHCLRHYRCSELAKQGVALEDIAEFVGHSNTETTKLYIHA